MSYDLLRGADKKRIVDIKWPGAKRHQANHGGHSQPQIRKAAKPAVGARLLRFQRVAARWSWFLNDHSLSSGRSFLFLPEHREGAAGQG